MRSFLLLALALLTACTTITPPAGINPMPPRATFDTNESRRYAVAEQWVSNYGASVTLGVGGAQSSLLWVSGNSGSIVQSIAAGWVMNAAQKPVLVVSHPHFIPARRIIGTELPLGIDLHLEWLRDPNDGAWWLSVNGERAGSIASSNFNSGPLAVGATRIVIGGETTSASLGTGATFHSPKYKPVGGDFQPATLTPITSQPCYTMKNEGTRWTFGGSC